MSISRTWQERAEDRGLRAGEIHELETAIDASAGMAASILLKGREGKSHRELLIENVEKLHNDLTRRQEHPLGYDGDLTVAYALAAAVFAERCSAGSEDVLASEYGVTGDE